MSFDRLHAGAGCHEKTTPLLLRSRPNRPRLNGPDNCTSAYRSTNSTRASKKTAPPFFVFTSSIDQLHPHWLTFVHTLVHHRSLLFNLIKHFTFHFHRRLCRRRSLNTKKKFAFVHLSRPDGVLPRVHEDHHLVASLQRLPRPLVRHAVHHRLKVASEERREAAEAPAAEGRRAGEVGGTIKRWRGSAAAVAAVDTSSPSQTGSYTSHRFLTNTKQNNSNSRQQQQQQQ